MVQQDFVAVVVVAEVVVVAVAAVVVVVEVEGRNRDDECSGMPVEKQRPCLLLPRLECLIVW